MKPFALTLAAGVLAGASAAAQVPITLSQSGFVLDASDVPVDRTGVAFSFSIWDDASSSAGSSRVWPPTPNSCALDVRRGYYAISLGAGCAPGLTSAHLPAGASRFIELTIDGVTLTPRQLLTGAPSAATASRALDSDRLGGVLATSLLDGTGKILAGALPTGAGGVALLDGSGKLASGVLPAIADAQIASNAAIAVTKLAGGSAGQVLTMSGGVPAWSAPTGGVTSFNTRTGAISLSSGDVTGALGFTPFNPANALALPSNGLTVGANELAVRGGLVGIGIAAGATPAAALEVGGGVKIGNDAAQCTSAKAGTLRWTGAAIEYCAGDTWRSLRPGLSGAGGTVTDVGGYRIHTFTGPGTFTTSGGGSVEVLVVGGGGGGGWGNTNEGGGGGGAGGLCYKAAHTLAGGSYAVAVGAAGGAPASSAAKGGNGGDSSFDGIVAVGGGGGGSCGTQTGAAGGSGGGGQGCGQDNAGAAATQPATSNGATCFGNAGGTGRWVSTAPGNGNGGGGGGAGATGAAGQSRPNQSYGGGGAGRDYAITGTTVTYAKGGDGGPGQSSVNGVAASPANSGHGGVGGNNSGGAGATGIVVIRYPL